MREHAYVCYMREEPQPLLIKINRSFYSFERGQISLGCERQTDGGRHTDILTHNFFFSWPYYGVLSSRPPWHFYCFSAGGTQLKTALGHRPQQGALSDCMLALTHTACNWLQLTRTITRHMHISFHNAHDFRLTTWLLPLIYPGASCSEKSLIDNSVKGQYATCVCMYIYSYSQAMCLSVLIPLIMVMNYSFCRWEKAKIRLASNIGPSVVCSLRSVTEAVEIRAYGWQERCTG